MARWLGLIFLLAPAIVHADEAAIQLLPLSGMKYSVERIGMFTYLHCDSPRQPDCALFERLAPQVDLDWNALQAKAGQASKKKGKTPAVRSKAGIVDQHGGLWIVALLGERDGRAASFLTDLTYAIVPTFPGYRVKFDDKGQVASADVVSNEVEWKKAVAAQPKKKKGLAKLLE